MSNVRHLPRAPISEALVDFRVKTSRDARADTLRSIRPDLLVRYPKITELRDFKAYVELGPRGDKSSVSQDVNLAGFRFESPDGREIAQFRLDGFTLNRLKPYTSWSDLRPKALELWREYVRVAQPELTTRLALRFINRIPLGSQSVEQESVLRLVLSVPPDLPQNVAALSSRVTLQDSGPDAVHVQQSFERDVSTGDTVLILDIDAFVEHQFANDSAEIGTTLDRLCELKDRVFFGALTETTLEQFS